MPLTNLKAFIVPLLLLIHQAVRRSLGMVDCRLAKMKIMSESLIKTLLLLPALIFFSSLQVHASTETVSLPLSIDYQLLKSIIIKTAYTDDGQTAILLNENDGCQKITISKPTIREKNAQILFETKLHIVAGTYMMNNCVLPVEWEGYLALVQKPIVDSKWNLSFETVDSILYDNHHRPSKITGIVWDLVKTQVYEYIESITIRLAPPILEAKSILVEMLPLDLQVPVQIMLESMRPGKINPAPEALQIGILTEVVKINDEGKKIERERISEKNLDVLMDTWEAWDSFLVHLITSLSNEPVPESDRQILLDALLETRYRFVTDFLNGTVERDFVREQFMSTWEKVSPVFRNQLGDDPSSAPFGYLAFFTAADALSALDKIGPTVGIEISRNGLIRLARLLAEDKSLTLEYRPGVNSELRNVLGLGDAPDASGPVTTREELDIENEEIDFNEKIDSKFKRLIMPFMCRSAWAGADKTTITFKDIIPWVFSKKNPDTYVDRIKALLEEASDAALGNSKIQERYYDLYRRIVISTAWQESCFRQFRVRKRKVTYLLSYNRTSVGLMQINERVWRGMYDPHHLRWNIQYNAAAGCEILELYLRKYALDRIKKRKPEMTIDKDTFARIVYAMYNGGPDQFEKVLQRKKEGTFYSSDKLYFEKYSWVKNRQWENIGKCLIGG